MRKSKYIIPISILLLINLLIFIGVASWIIPSYKESESVEDITGLVNKYLGGQSVTESNKAQWPISKDESVIATPDFDNTWFKAGNLGSWTQYAPSTPGQYDVKYIINGKEYIVTFTINSSSAEYVAYINTNIEGNRYTKLEDALNAAVYGDKVWVIVRGKPTNITSNCTIKEGVTLNIPYGTPNSVILDGEDTNRLYTLVHNNQQAPAHTNEAQYLKNEVIISSGVTLTNNGTLNIGGVISGGGGGTVSGYNASGYTDTGNTNDAAFINGDYAQISLNSNSKIDSSGTINCYGYIVDIYSENASTINNAIRPKVTLTSGNVYIPFAVVENRGGSRFTNMAGGIWKYAGGAFVGNINLDLDYAPFSRFYVQNIPCLIEIQHGASIIGLGNLYANSQNNSTDVTLISTASNSMIQTKSNGYIYCYSIINRDASKDNGASILDIDVYGGCAVNGLELTITADIPVLGTRNVNISTKGLLLPISWQYDISFNGGGSSGETSAVYEINHDIKLLPGSKLTISENATVNGTSYSIVTYNNNIINTSSGNQSIRYDEYQIQADRYTGKTISGIDPNSAYLIDTASPFYYPNDKGTAKLIVNGTLNVNKLGGLVETQNTGAMISFKSNYVESLELISIGTFTTNADSTLTYTSPSSTDATSKSQDYGSYLTLKLYEGTDKTPKICGGSSGSYTYYSKEGYWSTSSESYAYTIEYNDNGIGDIQDSNTFKYSGNYYPLTIYDLPILNQYHYIFKGWYFDSSFSDKADVGDTIRQGTTKLYAKWEIINYWVNYEMIPDGVTIPYHTNDGNSEFINISSLANNQELPLLTPEYTDTESIFAGWSLTKSGPYIYNLLESDLEYINNGVLTLYGIWKKPESKTIKVTFKVKDTKGEYIETTIQYKTETGTHQININSEYTAHSSSGNNDVTNNIYFKSWYYDESLQDKIDESDANVFVLSKDITIYAELIQKYTVTIDQTVAGSSVLKEYAYGQYVLPAYTYDITNNKDGELEFKGWLLDGSTSALSSGSVINIDANTTIRASITKTITVNFDPNGGDVTPTSLELSFDYGSSKAIGTLYNPTKTGHNFLGWYKENTFANLVNTSTTFNSNTTIYAKWELKTITVIFDPNGGNWGGSTTPITKTGLYGDTLISPDNPTRSGYNFKGWTNLGSTFPADNTIYKASWDRTCVTGDTLITLADGSQRRIDELTGNELIRVYDHEIGDFNNTKIGWLLKHDKSPTNHTIIKLEFADGTTLKLISAHTLFNVSINEYVIITAENADKYINNEFACLKDNKLAVVKLKNIEIYEEKTISYSIVSYGTITAFTNNILSSTPFVEILLNGFGFDNEFKYINYEEDVNNYGYYTYEELSNLLSYQEYEIINAKKFKILIGKGVISWDDFLQYIELLREMEKDFTL